MITSFRNCERSRARASLERISASSADRARDFHRSTSFDKSSSRFEAASSFMSRRWWTSSNSIWALFNFCSSRVKDRCKSFFSSCCLKEKKSKKVSRCDEISFSLKRNTKTRREPQKLNGKKGTILCYNLDSSKKAHQEFISFTLEWWNRKQRRFILWSPSLFTFICKLFRMKDRK